MLNRPVHPYVVVVIMFVCLVCVFIQKHEIQTKYDALKSKPCVSCGLVPEEETE